MILEALLAFAHISAVILLVVFLSAKTALLHVDVVAASGATGAGPGWLARMRRLDQWTWVGFAAIAASGAARVAWGAKGWHWYLANPLLWAKIALFVAMVAMAPGASRELARWRGGQSDADAQALRAHRKRLMWQAHLMVLIPLFGCLLAYGF